MPPDPGPRLLGRIRELLVKRLGTSHLYRRENRQANQSFFHTCKDNLFFEKPSGLCTFVSRIQANDL